MAGVPFICCYKLGWGAVATSGRVWATGCLPAKERRERSVCTRTAGMIVAGCRSAFGFRRAGWLFSIVSGLHLPSEPLPAVCGLSVGLIAPQLAMGSSSRPRSGRGSLYALFPLDVSITASSFCRFFYSPSGSPLTLNLFSASTEWELCENDFSDPVRHSQRCPLSAKNPGGRTAILHWFASRRFWHCLTIDLSSCWPLQEIGDGKRTIWHAN